MAQNDIFKRYLDAGMNFTQLSRERAEEFVKDLVKAGDVRRKEAEEVIETLVERSRKNTEELVDVVRREVADQLRNLGLEDLARRAGLPDAVADRVDGAAQRIGDIAEEAAATVAPAPVKKAPPAKKAAPAKKTGPVAKKAAAKKAAPVTKAAEATKDS